MGFCIGYGKWPVSYTHLLRTNCKPDVALVTVTPPDEHGFVSLGISVDYTMEAVKQAKTVIAQVNKYMPRTHGDSFVHVDEISDFVEFDEPILELPNPKITEVEEAIGRNCASLIKDGDCLQLGIGAKMCIRDRKKAFGL